MKIIATVIFLIITAVSIDSLFGYWGIPIVTMDLIFVPFSIFIIGWVFSPSYLSGGYITWEYAQSDSAQLLGVVSTAIVLLLLGMLMIYLGFSNPLELYVGARGGGHGYTLLIVGLAMLCFIFSTAYVCFNKKCTGGKLNSDQKFGKHK